MEIRIEAVNLLRRTIKEGATIGRLVDLLVALYRRRSQSLSDLELVRCFEEAFDLNMGAANALLIAQLHGGLDALTVGDATAYIFPEILQTREKWDPVEFRQGHRFWIDTLPTPPPANSAPFEHPRFPEWDLLSQQSQKYVIRLAMSSAFYGHALQLVACLAERLQSKAVGLASGESQVINPTTS